VFSILSDGKIGDKTALNQDTGKLGPNKERQEAPHAHWIETSADNRLRARRGLGPRPDSDFPIDAAKGMLGPHIPPAAR